jgi:ABC-type uncharacterized transport system substrate-binding protein
MHGLMLWLVFFSLASTSGALHAAILTVLLSEDTAPYRDFAVAFEKRIGKAHNVVRVTLESPALETSLSYSTLTIAVGVKAAEHLASSPAKAPAIAAMVPRAWYRDSGQERLNAGGREATAIYIDQPYERYCALVRDALPDAMRVGILQGKPAAPELKAELAGVAKKFNLKLVWQTVGDQDVIPQLEKTLEEVDVLLALPDPVVYNRYTAQVVFLTTLRYRVPVIGYSQGMSRAGALISLYALPPQLGTQAADTAVQYLEAARLPKPADPRDFDLAVNGNVARALGVVLPGKAVLQDLIEKRSP